MLVFASVPIWGQKNYIIEYSNKNNTFQYFISSEDGSESKKKQVRSFHPKPDDHITMVVKDYNGFIYSPQIGFKSEVTTNQTPTSLSVLGSMSSALLGVDLSFLSKLHSIPLSRGEAQWNPEEKEVMDQLSILENQSSLLMEKWEIQNDILSISHAPQKTTAEIKKELTPTIQRWKETPDVDWNSLHKAAQHLENSSTKNLRSTITDQLSQIADVQNQLKSIEQTPLMTNQQILQLENLALQIPESTSLPVSLASLKSDETANGTLENITVQISFLEQDLTQSALSNTSAPSFPHHDKIIYFNPHSWKNPNGQITHEWCEGCEPVVKAEGYFNYQNSQQAMPPAEFESLFNQHPGAYGEWKIYDDEGKLKQHLRLQNFSTATIAQNPKTAFSQTHTISIASAPALQMGTGIFMNQTFEDRFTYRKFQNLNGDSVLISSEAHGDWIPSLGAQMRLLIPNSSPVQWGLNLGGSVNAFSNIDAKKMNLHLGSEMSLKSFSYLSVSMGLSACRTNRLNKNYQINHWYTQKDLFFSDVRNDNNNVSNLTQEIFKWGWYVGLNLNF